MKCKYSRKKLVREEARTGFHNCNLGWNLFKWCWSSLLTVLQDKIVLGQRNHRFDVVADPKLRWGWRHFHGQNIPSVFVSGVTPSPELCSSICSEMCWSNRDFLLRERKRETFATRRSWFADFALILHLESWAQFWALRGLAVLLTVPSMVPVPVGADMLFVVKAGNAFICFT